MDPPALETAVDLPIVDLAYDVHGRFVAPGMPRSLALAYDLHVLGNGAVEWFDPPIRSPILKHLAIAGVAVPVDLALNVFVDTWVHEEWHRAVLARHDIASHDGAYVLSHYKTGLIPVDRVADADLVRLKSTSPPDMVRLHEAGFEAQRSLVQKLEAHTLYDKDVDGALGPFETVQSGYAVLEVASFVGEIGYLYECINPDNGAQDAAFQNEPMRDRDFTGLDCTGWTYDLHRPDEPYTGRGPHPSGDGIDRYRWWGDLSWEEQRYLKMATHLYWLNAVDPNLLGVNGITVGAWRFQPTLAEVLTPLGITVDQRVLFRHLTERNERFGVVVHQGFGTRRWFPGVEGEVVDVPVGSFEVDGRAGVWLQPRDLRGDATTASPGGLLSLRAAWDRRVAPWAEVRVKSEGWVQGDVDLGPSLAFRLGLTLGLF